MEVRYLLLARYAEMSPDGAFAAMGAGLDTQYVPALPFNLPTLYLIIKIAFDRDEVARPHKLRVRLRAPDGEEIVSLDEAEAPAYDEMPPNRQYLFVNMLLGLQNLLFQTAGLYTVQLLCDDEVAKAIEFRVELQSQPAQTQEPPSK